jgi:hypothetical protein
VPTLLKWNGYRFYFFSNESGEPPHVHVDKQDKTAKFWLKPVELASSEGFKHNEVGTLLAKVKQEQAHFLRAWNEYFKAHR